MQDTVNLFRDAYITKNASFMGILVRYFDPHKVHKMIKRPKVFVMSKQLKK
jgi:hypothetical protein